MAHCPGPRNVWRRRHSQPALDAIDTVLPRCLAVDRAGGVMPARAQARVHPGPHRVPPPASAGLASAPVSPNKARTETPLSTFPCELWRSWLRF